MDICQQNLAICRKEIWRAPLQEIRHLGGYSRVVLHCPSCGATVASYKVGPAYCENGLYSSEWHNCRCGQKIDYRDVPYARH